MRTLSLLHAVAQVSLLHAVAQPTLLAEVPQLQVKQEESQGGTLNTAMTGEGNEAGHCLAPVLVDQLQCEDVPGRGSYSVSFC